ncbi:MAG: hypothetical protein HS108_00915 [Planctomycetes bacterium]|nr:hypothetical protein [Planctomycetota bacterium]MCL4729105.1 hypothetical protein [Planctomycetota bacterium]
MGRVAKVLDRNGEVVPFRRSRVVRAILAAVRAAGSRDEWVADKLADMVVYFLDLNHGDSKTPPTAEDIDDTIEKALLSSPDLAAVSQAFIAARRQGRELRALEQAAREDPAGPEVERGHVLQGWNRARITAALVRENGLDVTRAAEVAAAVEQRVAGLNLPRLTTGLIREFVDVELYARGLSTQPGTLHVPRHDIDQWLFPADDDPPAATQSELADRASRRVLGEYALAAILPATSRELHLQARLHFHGLDTPVALAQTRLDAVAALAEGAGFGLTRQYPARAQGLTAAFARLAVLVRHASALTSGPIVLRRLDEALAHEPDLDRAALQEGLRLLAWQAPNPLRLEMGPPGAPGRDLVARALLDALAGEDAPLRARVSLELALTAGAFSDPARRALVERAALAACHCGEPSFRLSETGAGVSGGLFGETGAHRHAATLARASLNLVAPALAARDLAGCLAALDPAIEAVAEGLSARVRFLERVAMRDLPDPVAPPARMLRVLVGQSREVSLTPVGLATAGALVAGADRPEAETALRAGQQVLSYLAFKFRQCCARHNLTGQIGAWAGAAAARMAGADMAGLAAADPESPLRLRLADDSAYLPGTGLDPRLPVGSRLAHESALHALAGREAELTVSPDQALTGEELAALIRAALAEGAVRPTRLSLSVRHRLCRDCGTRSVATAESCPHCGSTAWAVPPGQKTLFG